MISLLICSFSTYAADFVRLPYLQSVGSEEVTVVWMTDEATVEDCAK